MARGKSTGSLTGPLVLETLTRIVVLVVVSVAYLRLGHTMVTQHILGRTLRPVVDLVMYSGLAAVVRVAFGSRSAASGVSKSLQLLRVFSDLVFLGVMSLGFLEAIR